MKDILLGVFIGVAAKTLYDKWLLANSKPFYDAPKPAPPVKAPLPSPPIYIEPKEQATVDLAQVAGHNHINYIKL